MRSSRINGINDFVQIVRAARRSKVSTPSDHAEAHAPDSVERLDERLAVALKGLDFDTDAGRQAAGRVVVGEIMAWEFGPGIREHAEFRTMVDAIEASLSREPRLAARMREIFASIPSRK